MMTTLQWTLLMKTLLLVLLRLQMYYWLIGMRGHILLNEEADTIGVHQCAVSGGCWSGCRRKYV